jgi:hypothetical protein
VSGLRFDRLTASSKDDAVALAQAFLRSIAACTCSAFNPPCPTCSDDAVALAKVRVDGCDVIDVCALERSWVLSPRALGYWVPVVDMFRQCLEQACCEPPGSNRQPVDPIHCMGTSLEEAWKTFDGAFAGASGTSPAFRELLQAMGRPVVPEPAVATPASAEGAIGALEAKIAELSKRIDELSAGVQKEQA